MHAVDAPFSRQAKPRAWTLQPNTKETSTQARRCSPAQHARADFLPFPEPRRHDDTTAAESGAGVCFFVGGLVFDNIYI